MIEHSFVLQSQNTWGLAVVPHDWTWTETFPISMSHKSMSKNTKRKLSIHLHVKRLRASR